MFRTLIQVAAITLTLAASFFLLKGNLSLSAAHIAELSETRWNYNQPVLQSLSRQQADTKLGFIFLLVAFVLQLGNLLWPMRYVDFEVNKLGVVVALVVSAILFVGGLLGSKVLGQRIERQAVGILEQQRAKAK